MTTYYVSNAGSDLNNGTDPSTPWQTVAKVNATSFNPGDSILFNRGEADWREKLLVSSSGMAGSPITIGAYGSGTKPRLNGSDVISGFTPCQILNASIFSANVTGNQADGVRRNYRQVATVTGSSTTIKIRLTAADSADWVIVAVGVGIQTSGNTAASMTQVTWSGSVPVTIPKLTYADSDSVALSVTAGQTLLIHVYFSARNFKYAGSGQQGFYYDAIVADESMIAGPTGSQLNAMVANESVVTAVLGVSKIIWSTSAIPSHPITSITSSSTTATVTTPTAHHLYTGQWITILGASPAGYNLSAQVAVTSPTTFTYTLGGSLSSPATGTITYEMACPCTAWENNLFLHRQTSITNVGAIPGSFYFDTTARVFYVNGYSQDDPTSNGKTYEIPHLAYSIHDNAQAYLDISDIDCCQSYGSADATGTITTGAMSGIILQGSHNIVHDLSSFNHCRHNFFFYTGSTNCLGYNLTIRDAIGSTPFGAFGTGTSSNTLRYGTIYNSQVMCIDDGLIVIHGTATGTVVEYCDLWTSVANPTSHTINSLDAGTDGNIFRYNRIRFLTTGATTAFILNGCDNDEIYGNQIEWSASSLGAIVMENGTGGKIYDNTIIGNPALLSADYQIQLVNQPNVVVKNNIITGAYALNLDAASETGFVSDYNCFYNAAGVKWTWGGSDYTTLATWQSAGSQDALSLNTDPQFTTPGSDYSLSSVSPCLQKGTYLGSPYSSGLTPGATWPSGVATRAFANPPDIGAFATTNPVADGACTASKATVNGSATFTIPVYTGAASATAKKSTASGSSTFTPPTFTGVGSCSAKKCTASGAATFGPPAFNGAGSCTSSKAMASGSATFVPIYNGVGSASASKATGSGTSTFTAPVYSVSGSVSAKNATASGSATPLIPTYTASSSVSARKATALGEGIFALLFYSGAGSVTTAKATALGNGVVIPLYPPPWFTKFGKICQPGAVSGTIVQPGAVSGTILA